MPRSMSCKSSFHFKSEKYFFVRLKLESGRIAVGYKMFASERVRERQCQEKQRKRERVYARSRERKCVWLQSTEHERQSLLATQREKWCMCVYVRERETERDRVRENYEGAKFSARSRE